MSAPRIAQVNVQPGMVDLGIGQPGLDLLPVAVMQRATAHRLGQGEPDALNYGAEQGDGYLRRHLAAFLTASYASQVDEDCLFISAGASQALDLICTLCAQPGDAILVEEPSYFLALRIFEDHGLKVISVPMDQDGLVIDAVVEAARQHRPRFLYTIPTFQNPSGVTLSAERRSRLAALAEELDFLIVADEVYQLLGYTAAPPPPLAHFGQNGRVLSVGSFSKILAPGLRLGWIQAAPSWVARFVRCGLVDSGGGLNPFTSSIVRSVLELGLLDEHLAMLKRSYAGRITVMDEALQSLASAVAYTRPDGGFFFWLTLPDGIDSEALLASARANNVGFTPGVRFSSRQGLRNCLRLSFAYFEADQLREGIGRLGRVLELTR